MIKGFDNIFRVKHVILTVFALFFISFICVGSSFAVTGNNTNISNSSTNNNVNVIVQNNSTNVTNPNNLSNIQGMYINPSDTPASSINTSSLKSQGINTVFIYTDRQDPQDTLEPYINEFNGTGISVYAWVACFLDFNGNYFTPGTNVTLENEIISDIDNITLNYNINGVMLDYLQYNGDAYLYPNATLEVDDFASAIRGDIDSVNNMDTSGKPFIYLSATLMPEDSINDYYYGQNYTSLSSILDFLSPEIYVGNYVETTSWIGSTTAYIVSQAEGTPVVTILQTYLSDSNVTPISVSQLDLDIQTALFNGSGGFELFRYGLLPVNWTGYQPPTPTPPPVVTGTSTFNVTYVPVSALINIIFNENITTATDYIDISLKDLRTGNVLTLASLDLNSVINGNILTLMETGNRLFSDTFQVSIPVDSVESMSGNLLAATYTFNFTSPTPPSVINNEPVGNASNVDLSSPVIVGFNENITAGSDFNNISIENLNTVTFLNITKTISGHTLILTGTRSFGDSYLVYLPVDAVSDNYGDNLTSAYNFTFTTIPELKVESTTPVNQATSVSLTSPVVIKFNDNILEGVNYNKIYMENLVTGKLVNITKTVSGDTLTLTGTRSFGDSYLVYIPVDAVTDIYGDNLTSIYNFTFTTIPLLKVESTTPVNQATGVDLSSPVTVNFNDNILEGVNYSKIYIENLATGKLVNISKTVSGDTLTLTGTRSFGDSYLVYIPVDAVTDIYNHNLTSAYSFTFTTIPELKVESTSPVNNATGVSLTSPVTVKFNDNILEGVNYNKIYIENLATDKLVNITKTVSGDTLTLTGNRSFGDSYLVYLPVGAVTDIYGHNLTSIYSFTFTTIPELEVESTIPVNNATGVSLTSPVVVKFNDNILEGADFKGVIVKNLSTGSIVTVKSIIISGNTLTITLNNSRLYNDTYMVILPANAVSDVYGDYMSDNYSFIFKTLQK